MVTEFITITELSNLTGKSRPTIYKYLSAYQRGEKSDIPYAFIQLFELIETTKGKKTDIAKFCSDQFTSPSPLRPLWDFIQAHAEKIDVNRAIEVLTKEFAL